MEKNGLLGGETRARDVIFARNKRKKSRYFYKKFNLPIAFYALIVYNISTQVVKSGAKVWKVVQK
jgi:hypothetical protein